MKMTPEQKAFRDYGMALGELKRLRKEVVYNLAHYRGIKKNGAILIFRKCLCERDVLIKEAWRKRAVCRAWAHLERRECRTCRYHDEIRNFEICRDCTPGIHLENFCNWEPGTVADAAGENTDVNPHNSLINAPAQVGETLADDAGGNPGENLYNSLENNEEPLAETLADGKEAL